jgi:hypothetical protein
LSENVEFLVSPSRATTCGALFASLASALPKASRVATSWPFS